MKLKKRRNLIGKKIKSLIMMLLMVVMVVGALPLSVSAAAQNVTVKKDVTYYPNGALKSITPIFGWESGKAAANVQLVLMKKQLNSTTAEKPAHGDFTDFGTYGNSFGTYDDAVAYDKGKNGIFGIIAASDTKKVTGGSSDNELTISLKEGDIPLSDDGYYYIYLWTYYNNHYYPDNLLCVVRVQDGRAQYTAATGRNDYNENDFSAVVSLDLEAVTFAYAYDAQRNPSYPAKADTKIVMSRLITPLLADGTRGQNHGSWKFSKAGTYAGMNNTDNIRLQSVVSKVAEQYELNEKSVVIHELKENETHVAYGVVISYDVLEGYAVFLGDTWNGGAGYLLSLKEISEDPKTITAGTIATDFIDAEAPNAVFTAEGTNGGTLTDVDISMKYQVVKNSTAGGWIDISNTSVTLTGLDAGNIIQIKRAGNGTTTKDSPLQEIAVTQAAKPMNLAGVACTTSNQDDGKITGVDNTMEYKLSAASGWTAVTESTLTGLSNGTYQVRVKANETVLASESAVIEIGKHIHVGTLSEKVEAKCEEAGSKPYYSCECGKYFEDADCITEITDLANWKVIPATGHTGGTATCKTKAQCEVCGMEYGEFASHTMSANYEAENADPEKHYHVCSVCKAKDDAGEDHSWNVDAATEETDKHCEICGYVAEAKLDHVHVGTLSEKVEAKCEEAGSKPYYSCECGKYFEDADCITEITDLANWKVIPATGHTGGTATCKTKAQCEVCGMEYGEFASHTMSANYEAENADPEKHYHVCSVCKAKDDAGEDHSWNVDAATEETDKHCEICGYVAEAKLDHVHVGTLSEKVEAKCEEAGSKPYYSCECGKYFEDADCITEITDLANWKVIPATGHTPKPDDGDCTTAITCRVCGRETTAARSAHTGGTATCKAKSQCEVCGMEYGELAAHTWDEGIVTKQPTASVRGEKVFTCTAADCQATRTESIHKLEPSIIKGENGVWTQGSNQGLSFLSDAAFADLLNVAVDGTVIEQKNYTAVSGSIIVELKPEYLTTLAAGKHTLAIHSASGSAQTEFTIKGKEASSADQDINSQKPTSADQKVTAVETGDADFPMMWVLALAVSFVGIICISARKHRNS